MTEEEVTAAGEHAELDARQERESGAKTFVVDFVRSKPARAVVLARNAEEILSKLEQGEFEEEDDDGCNSHIEVIDVSDESE